MSARFKAAAVVAAVCSRFIGVPGGVSAIKCAEDSPERFRGYSIQAKERSTRRRTPYDRISLTPAFRPVLPWAMNKPFKRLLLGCSWITGLKAGVNEIAAGRHRLCPGPR